MSLTDGQPSETGARSSRRGRWLLGLASVMLVAWPFLVVRFAPITDLPQHAAQVGLFQEALASEGPYRIQWFTPYSLAYLPLATGMALAGPLAGARLGTALIALLWVGALHLLAGRLGRPPEAAAVASVLVFHHALYWGFLPFLVGFPIFVLWLLLVRRTPETGLPGAAAFAGLAALLFTAHALWFAAALAWLGLDTLLRLRRGGPRGAVLARLAGPAAVALGAFAWYGSIAATRFATPPLWLAQPWGRLLPGSLVEATFGGLVGVLEPAAGTALLAWLIAASLGRGRSAGRWDRDLLLAGLLLIAGALVLPDKFTNTIEFNDRWMAPGLALLLLAAPPLPLRRALRRALALTLLGAFVMTTAVAWQRAEAEELAGLEASLEALPENPSLLGLDFVRGSRYLDRQPYLQTFAWGQVVRRGELNFSFADFSPSLVIYDPPRKPPWTPGLEWRPQHVRAGDFGWFDHALVRASAATHRRLTDQPFLIPVTPLAPWRLYRITEDAPRRPFPGPGRQPR